MKLTSEQLDIVHHDPAKHATVLAVAGSGKTTTLVARIGHLVRGQGVPPAGIRAVMYNKAAQLDFRRKLIGAGLAMVTVQTFHAMGFGLLNWAAREGLHAPRTLAGERDARDLLREAIRSTFHEHDLDPREVPLDPDEAALAIATWKAMLTPPEDAHHLEEPLYEAVYRAFEALRAQRALLTFDDQIYDAVRLLEDSDEVRSRLENRVEHLVIDEFQDVNLARLRLAKHLAGSRARVMVVGDDDQCIYEWQGARSSYIKRGFRAELTHHPHATYKLTRSFRFGPLIAQLAANVIGHNTDRVEKELAADDLAARGAVALDVLEDASGRVIEWLQARLAEGAEPADVAILVRKYSQSYGLQVPLLLREVPFFVEGQPPLANAHPIKLALAYLDAAAALDEPLTRYSARALAFLVNRPLRYVRKDAFKEHLAASRRAGRRLAEALGDVAALEGSGVHHRGVGALGALEATMRRAAAAEPPGTHRAGAVLSLVLDAVDFGAHFLAYAGVSRAEEHIALMRSLALLLTEADVAAGAARVFVEGLDPRRGRPDHECFRITSIFKAKGLEWDHVVLPELVDGQCPDLRVAVNVCANRRDPGRVLDPTESLESERRLFYVAVTRARRSLLLSASAATDSVVSRFVHEARVEPTAEAVAAVQDVLLAGGAAGGPAVEPIRRGARLDAHLRGGLVRMLRQAQVEAPELARALDPLTLDLLRTEAAPFSYPRAYPEPGAASGQGPRGGTGLPF